MKLLVVLCLAALECSGSTLKQARRFPEDFIFGTSTASHQIEGAWNVDGKSENIWDRLTHTRPELIKDGSNADIAANSYYNYKRDVEMLRELGVNAYRFSLSWSRILPDGFANRVNEAGIDYYNNYINELLKYNIKPMVTLYHWDLPQKLQDLGGFSNPLIADWFEDYARVAFEHFGDRVKLWLTFNEPREICYDGYGSTAKAPILNASGIGEYICAKNLLMSHARAYNVYKNDFKPIQDGQCGITISISSALPLTDSEDDILAVETNRQIIWAQYADPIFSKEGGFPEKLSELVAKKSAEQGYPRSRLPQFTEEEKAFVRGSSDFLGVNHYGGFYISASRFIFPSPVPSMYDDAPVGRYVPLEWPRSVSSWLFQTPDSIFIALTDLKERYNNPDLYITENGWSTYTGLEDDGRVRYYRAAWESALDALDAGVNLKGYMAWSLMDNFEWLEGYVERFGLYEVDFEDPARTRTPRKSAFVYKELIRTREVNHDYEPETLVMTIDDGH